MRDFSVPKPMARPDYTFDHTPTTDELRQMAVKAMRDMLSIQWYIRQNYTFKKTGPVSGKLFVYNPETVYAGLPYTNGDKGMFQWMEYYNQETGCLEFDGDAQAFNLTFGNTCTSSLMWAWSTVCSKLTGIFVNFYMVPKHGCYPVGDYTFDYSIDSYLEYSTKTIIEDYGRDRIFEAYAKVLPADAVASSPVDHGMMAIEAAHVVRDENGRIDGDESYIMIQDQRGGQKEDGSFYDRQEGEDILHFSGRTEFKYTFNMLINEWYIPCTAPEFMGTKPYEQAVVVFRSDLPKCETMEELLQGTLWSNYPIAVLKAILTDEQGGETLLHRILFTKWDVAKGITRKYPIANMAEALALDGLAPGKYTLRLEATVPNGQVFVPASIQIEK